MSVLLAVAMALILALPLENVKIKTELSFVPTNWGRILQDVEIINRTDIHPVKLDVNLAALQPTQKVGRLTLSLDSVIFFSKKAGLHGARDRREF